MSDTEYPVILRMLLVMSLLFMAAGRAVADIEVEYHAAVTAQASSKSLAPYMLGSWNYGRYAEGNGIWQEAGAFKSLDMSKRFSWSAGFDYLAGVGQKTDYMRWDKDSETWGVSDARRNAFRIQQMFGELKYRSAFLTLGMKETHSLIVDDVLSSGDLTRSNNATPIPGIAVGFLDFVDIPFTKGWVQINGELMYGRMMDSNFKKREFNYNYGDLSQDLFYNYKRCYFRTNPDKNFYVTIGMQAAGMFGGTMYKYKDGVIYNTMKRGFKLKDVLQMFFPMEGGENYYTGSHLGTWDFKADLKFGNGSQLSAYFEWPWEDGSGIGRMNGWDGLWGLQYDCGSDGIISRILVEYLDFTNQSGPIHFDPDDNPFNPISGHAQGADDYYNNAYYGAYTNYGMGIGSPFLRSPIYNFNGNLSYLHNRARGCHVAIEGYPTEWLSFRVMAGYELAGGKGPMPAYRKLNCTSGLVSLSVYPFKEIPLLEVGLKFAFDKGSLRGDNLGGQIQVSYNGLFNIK